MLKVLHEHIAHDADQRILLSAPLFGPSDAD